jgi:hypothetical protein
MANTYQPMVMDIFPFPNGQGFSGAKAWWKHVLNLEEKRRLNNLVGIALLDTGVRNRLIDERDPALYEAFGLSDETKRWLQDVSADTLDELASIINAAFTDAPLLETA